jgi:hypothetical protein
MPWLHDAGQVVLFDWIAILQQKHSEWYQSCCVDGIDAAENGVDTGGDDDENAADVPESTEVSLTPFTRTADCIY